MNEKSNTRKWLTNGHEETGICETQTEAFIPVENFQKMIEAINVLHEETTY